MINFGDIADDVTDFLLHAGQNTGLILYFDSKSCHLA
jgi:hypothetical protein